MSTHIIHLSENAMMDLTVAGLEGYIVRKPNRKNHTRLEAYGLLWGHHVDLPDGDHLFVVEKLTTDSLAIRKNDSVAPSDGLEIIKDLVTSYWPQYALLGDFHTHPCEHYRDVVSEKSYEFSEDDREHMLELADWDPDYRLALVLTIAYLERTTDAPPNYVNGQCITWDFNNYRFWLNACVVVRSEDLEDADESEDDESDEDEVPELQLCPDSSDWEEQYEVEEIDVLLRCPYLMPPIPASAFGKKRGDVHVVGCV